MDELKTTRDRGLITEDEYETKRRQILDDIVREIPLPLGNKAAVNRLDDESGSKVVATRGSESVAALALSGKTGAGGGS